MYALRHHIAGTDLIASLRRHVAPTTKSAECRKYNPIQYNTDLTKRSSLIYDEKYPQTAIDSFACFFVMSFIECFNYRILETITFKQIILSLITKN
jgi:hypothetical protein